MSLEIGSLPADVHNNMAVQNVKDSIAKRLGAIAEKMAGISYEPTGGFAIRPGSQARPAASASKSVAET